MINQWGWYLESGCAELLDERGTAVELTVRPAATPAQRRLVAVGGAVAIALSVLLAVLMLSWL